MSEYTFAGWSRDFDGNYNPIVIRLRSDMYIAALFEPSVIDNCPDDPDKTEPGICGCGIPDTDMDNDEPRTVMIYVLMILKKQNPETVTAGSRIQIQTMTEPRTVLTTALMILPR